MDLYLSPRVSEYNNTALLTFAAVQGTQHTYWILVAFVWPICPQFRFHAVSNSVF